MKQGIIWRQYEDIRGTSTYLQFVVPHHLQEEILQHFHARVMGDHVGEEKTVAKIKERFYWPGISMMSQAGVELVQHVLQGRQLFRGIVLLSKP